MSATNPYKLTHHARFEDRAFDPKLWASWFGEKNYYSPTYALFRKGLLKTFPTNTEGLGKDLCLVFFFKYSLVWSIAIHPIYCSIHVYVIYLIFNVYVYLFSYVNSPYQETIHVSFHYGSFCSRTWLSIHVATSAMR